MGAVGARLLAGAANDRAGRVAVDPEVEARGRGAETGEGEVGRGEEGAEVSEIGGRRGARGGRDVRGRRADGLGGGDADEGHGVDSAAPS
jgi:hypothetical protein